MVDSPRLPIFTVFKNKDLFDSFIPETRGFLHVAGWEDVLPGEKYAGGVGKGTSTLDNDSISVFDEQPQKRRESKCSSASSSQLSPAGLPAVWVALI